MNREQTRTLILRILHIWQPREGLPPYTMTTVHIASLHQVKRQDHQQEVEKRIQMTLEEEVGHVPMIKRC